MNRLLAGVLCLLLLFTPALTMAQPLGTVHQGDKIRLRLLETITSAHAHKGDTANFEVVSDYKTGDVVLIAAGSHGIGTIDEVIPARGLGRAGQLNISMNYVQAVDGTNVKVRMSQEKKGANNGGWAIGGALLLSVLFVFVKGAHAVIEKGTEIDVFVDEDKEIQAANAQMPSIQTSAPAPQGSPPGESIVSSPAYVPQPPPQGASNQGRSQGNAAESVPSLAYGERAPNFKLKDRSGRTVSLSQFKGRKLCALYFWMNDEDEYALTLGMLQRIYDRYASKNLIALAVHCNPPQWYKSKVQSSAIDYPVLRGSREVAGLYGLTPAHSWVYIVDAAGVVIFGQDAAAVSEAQMTQALDAVLGGR